LSLSRRGPALPAVDIDRATSYARQEKATTTRAAWRRILISANLLI
jgi:hypothetical protein